MKVSRPYTTSEARRRHWHRFDRSVACVFVVAFTALYHVNGDFIPTNDVTANVQLAMRVLDNRSFSFQSEDHPFMFVWSLATENGRRRAMVPAWDLEGPGGATWRELRADGRLKLEKPMYYLVPAVDHERQGYISIYGPGSAIVALPLYALLTQFVERIAAHPAAIWYGGKFVAALCVSISVAMVYLSARRLAGMRESLWIATAYGAGTNIWCMASQSLWQTGPNLMFVSIAIYCLLRMPNHILWAAGCGAAAGCGVLCRETTVIFVVVTAIAILAACIGNVAGARWRALVAFVMAGLPLALLLGWYNTHYMGSPFSFAKTEAAHAIAELKMGSPEIWQTPFFTGFYGLLISPSRGVFVFSPILLFAFAGILRVWKTPRYYPLIPLAAAALSMLLIYSKYFDWHSGWSFGSRYLTDTFPMLALCATSVATRIRRNKMWGGLFLFALFWSIGVQFIGAYAYDVVGWNNRNGYVVQLAQRASAPNVRQAYAITAGPRGQQNTYYFFVDPKAAEFFARQHGADVKPVYLDVDMKIHRRRLWSLGDSQLVYYLTRFAQSRAEKKRLMHSWLRPVGTEEQQ